MAYRGIVFGALTALLVSSQAVLGQSSGVPMNFPPSDFTGNQFVDNAGCAFVRAGIGGNVTWVPRVDRRRNQLCSFQPTFGAQSEAPAPVVAAAPAPVIAPTPAPAPTPENDQGAPITTVASTPLVQIPTANTPTARSPQIVANAPVRAAPPRPAPAPVAAREPAPARLQLAAFCEGRTGPQPGFVSSSTGQTINCGGQTTAPAITRTAAAAPAAPQPRRLTLAQACAEIRATGRPLVDGNTGRQVVCPQAAPQAVARTVAAAAPQPRQMTRQQVCAEIARTGRAFVNANTGAPIRCAAPRVATGPTAPATAALPAAPSATPRSTFVASACSERMLTVSGFEVRCGPQAQSPSSGSTVAATSVPVTRGVQTTRARASASTSGFSIPFLSEPVIPASNPSHISTRQVVKPPKGYTRVWTDGRHNPNRGLPRAQAAKVQAHVSSRSIAPATPAAPTHRYVQVGAFANAGNAQAVGRQFMSAGLPVGLASATSNGRAVKIVMLGPFNSSSALQRGLRAARGAGYGSAYTRN